MEVNYLSNPGITLDAILNNAHYDEITIRITTCLLIACIRDRTDVVLLLLHNGANPNYLGESKKLIRC